MRNLGHGARNWSGGVRGPVVWEASISVLPSIVVLFLVVLVVWCHGCKVTLISRVRNSGGRHQRVALAELGVYHRYMAAVSGSRGAAAGGVVAALHKLWRVGGLMTPGWRQGHTTGMRMDSSGRGKRTAKWDGGMRLLALAGRGRGGGASRGPSSHHVVAAMHHHHHHHLVLALPSCCHRLLFLSQ